MYPNLSSRFLPALASSHQVTTEVRLVRTDGVIELLDHIGGSVAVDRGSAVRRTCTVTVPDPALIPRTAADKISIYGAQLLIRRGIQYQDGTTETVALGTFRIDSVDGDVHDGPVTIQGKGLEAVIQDDRFTSPYTTRGGTGAVASITALIQASIPTAVVANQATDATLGVRTWDREGDRWAAVQEIATAIGAECYADADGQFVIAELPDLLAVDPVWDIAAGDDGALITATRGMNRDGMYNSVTAYGENAEENATPVSATVSDTDPGSPTYVSGPFGRVPRFYSSPTLNTTSACTNAATKILRDSVKPNALADITALPNPALEPGDVVRVTYGDGTRELHQIQSFTVPLETGGGDFVLATISGKEDT